MENENFKNSINELQEVTMTLAEKTQIYKNIVDFRAPAVKSPWSFNSFSLLLERNHLVTYVILLVLIFVAGGGVVFDILSNKNHQTVYDNADVFSANDNITIPNNVATDSIENVDVKKTDDIMASTPKVNPQVNPPTIVSKNTNGTGLDGLLPPTSRQGELSMSMATSAGPMTSQKEVLQRTWVWEKAILYDGTIFTPEKTGEFTLTFGVDKRVNGETDCNNFFGTYNSDDTGNLDFGPLATTMMYCDGSQESTFIDFVSKSKRYEINNLGSLIIYFNDNSGYIILK